MERNWEDAKRQGPFWEWGGAEGQETGWKEVDYAVLPAWEEELEGGHGNWKSPWKEFDPKKDTWKMVKDGPCQISSYYGKHGHEL